MHMMRRASELKQTKISFSEFLNKVLLVFFIAEL